MRVYISLLRMRLIAGLQYRAAAWAGMLTQFAWGFMEILAFSAFYRANPNVFPMEFSHLVSYIWIQQAFLVLIMPWGGGVTSAEGIINGDIAYDLARPLDLYNRWFCEMVSSKVSSFLLRCGPLLLVAFFLPQPYRLMLPPSVFQFLLFFVSISLTLGVVTAYMLIDATTIFFTLSKYNVFLVISAEFFSGSYIPLPFFPDAIRRVVELSPFGAMANMPLRIYSGDIAGLDAAWGIGLQVFWLVVLVVFGKWLMRTALRRVVSQGG